MKSLDRNDVLAIVQEGLTRLERRSKDASLFIKFGSLTAINVHVAVRDGNFTATLDLEEFAPLMLSTQLHPSHRIGEVAAATAAELAVKITDELMKQGCPHSVKRMCYSIDDFANGSFAAGRKQQAERGRGFFQFGRTRDSELDTFVRATVEQAMALEPIASFDQHVSLWMQPFGAGISTIYVNIYPKRGGGFLIEFEDRVQWPWKETSVKASSLSAVAEEVAKFMERHHNFALSGLNVRYTYFSHAVPEDKRAIEERDRMIVMARLPRRRGLFF